MSLFLFFLFFYFFILALFQVPRDSIIMGLMSEQLGGLQADGGARTVAPSLAQKRHARSTSIFSNPPPPIPTPTPEDWAWVEVKRANSFWIFLFFLESALILSPLTLNLTQILKSLCFLQDYSWISGLIFYCERVKIFPPDNHIMQPVSAQIALSSEQTLELRWNLPLYTAISWICHVLSLSSEVCALD